MLTVKPWKYPFVSSGVIEATLRYYTSPDIEGTANGGVGQMKAWE